MRRPCRGRLLTPRAVSEDLATAAARPRAIVRGCGRDLFESRRARLHRAWRLVRPDGAAGRHTGWRPGRHRHPRLPGARHLHDHHGVRMGAPCPIAVPQGRRLHVRRQHAGREAHVQSERPRRRTAGHLHRRRRIVRGTGRSDRAVPDRDAVGEGVSPAAGPGVGTLDQLVPLLSRAGVAAGGQSRPVYAVRRSRPSSPRTVRVSCRAAAGDASCPARSASTS